MSETGEREQSGLSRKKRALAGLTAGACLIAGVALWTSTMVKSPAQAAAEAGPPAPDVLTAPVERRVLSDTVVTRGTVSASQTLDIAPAGAAGEAGGKPVVTKVMVQSGRAFEAGRPLLEVSGRPVFALRGSLPVYRDLKPGAHGDDVSQLQRALRDLGHGTGSDIAGRYGPGTKQAVAALYESLGYEPVEAGGDKAEGDPLDAARDQVKTAQRALDSLLSAGGTRGTAEDGAEDGASGGAKNGVGADEVRYAREDLAQAQEALAEAEAVAGPMVPATEVVFLSGFPARVDSTTAKVGGPVGEKLMTVSAGRMVIRGSVGAHEKGLIRSGQKVKVLSEISGDEVTGTVSSVADTPASPSQDGEGDATADGGQGYAVVVKPDQPLPARLVGQDVRLTIEAATSKGKVLVVPVSAVSAGADSRATVTVLTTEGERRRVEVRPGTSGDGYTEVTPVGGDRLASGERVVVGVSAAAGDGTVR